MATTLIKNEDIEDTLKKLAPNKIAVAYLGADWEKFVEVEKEVNKFKEIIISPTLGTNPKAVKEVVEKIGWEKVFFFDALHAKIYLNTESKQVIIGSFNLSRNGIDADGLHEVGILSDDEQIYKEAYKEYKEIKEKAKNDYKNEASKKEQLEYLTQIRREYKSWNGNSKLQDKPVDILDYNFEVDTIHVMWFRYGDVELNVDELTKSTINRWTHCLPKDNINLKHWVLNWAVKKDGTLAKNPKPYWLYIHTKINKGVKGNDVGKYTTVLAEQNTENSAIQKPHEPFELTSKVVEAIRETLKKSAFVKLRPNKNKNDEGESDWYSKDCSEDLKKEFIEEVKKVVEIQRSKIAKKK